MKNIIDNYNHNLNLLEQIYREVGARKAAAASGNLFEHLIDDIVKLYPNLVSLKNDYLTSYCLSEKRDNVQVDRHIRVRTNNELKIAIEAKCYFDASHCVRAVANFNDIKRATNSDIKFAVVCGQNAVKDSTLRYYQALCQDTTGKSFELFTVNEIKTRCPSKPIYTEKFELDLIELNRLYEYIGLANS